ncbi:MAG: type 1 glutamine amidotransferase [Alphaproteobacteria bacterium]|nr:type 1 glutamine amidotransferase [Alphaproteobacteria bacterium]
MNILALQNHPASPPLLVGEGIAARGGEVTILRPHEGDAMPVTHAEYDGLLVLGGAMSAADPAYDRIFQPMTALMRDFAAADKPILGICLGSQLLARSFGGRVRRHTRLEVGYVPLRLTAAGRADPLLAAVEARPTLFEWHEDTFDLPAGAELLMTGTDCPVQAFRLGSAYGFQCHFEVDSDSVPRWLDVGREHLQSHYGERAPAMAERILAEIPFYAERARRFAAAVSGAWAERVLARRTARGREHGVARGSRTVML